MVGFDPKLKTNRYLGLMIKGNLHGVDTINSNPIVCKCVCVCILKVYRMFEIVKKLSQSAIIMCLLHNKE